MTSQINEFIQAVAGRAIPFLEAMAAIGVLSMAFLQTLKNMLPLRSWFQRWFVQRWLKQGADGAPRGRDLGAVDLKEAEKELLALTTAGDGDAFYGLPIEQLCGQLNVAAQAVVEFPDRYKDLLRSLTSLADERDLAAILRADLRQHLLTLQQQQKSAEVAEIVDARTRVMHQMHRSIDGLQISAGAQWKFLLQAGAFVLSALFTIAGLVYTTPRSQLLSPDTLAVFAVTGLLAGFLAPVARDLVASLEQLRK